MPADRLAPRVRPAATILFAGPLGAGVGIAADVLADVARLSHRTVIRRRDFTNLTPAANGTGSMTAVQLVAFGDAAHWADPLRVDIVIAWDEASAAALRTAGLEAGEWLTIDAATQHGSQVPTWRRDLITATAEPARLTALHRTARALKALSRRTPFTRDLWQRVLKLHVPARRRREVAGEL